MMTIRPIGKKLLVQPVSDVKRAHRGIEIPEKYKDPDRLFYVIAVGPDVIKDIKPGDRVYAYSYTSGFVPLDDGTGRGLLTQEQCVAVFPGQSIVDW